MIFQASSAIFSVFLRYSAISSLKFSLVCLSTSVESVAYIGKWKLFLVKGTCRVAFHQQPKSQQITGKILIKESIPYIVPFNQTVTIFISGGE